MLAPACTESAAPPPGGGTAGEGVELSVDVPATGRAFVNLSTPEVLAIADDGMTSHEWDLAFTGRDVFTNSGLSGPGDGGAFPLDYVDYDTGVVPSIPFLIEDEAGGAFSDWYAYNPAEHVIYSRFHVYGVASAGRYFKVQLYTFYGELQGAPVPALYQLQYAEVTAAGAGPATQVVDLDATAGGSEAPDTEPSACLALATGAELMLLPAEAAASTDWDLCFRRALVSVNGELGGPGDTTAADLDAGETASESLEQVMARTRESEAARFDAVDLARLTDPAVQYHGDRILSAFSDRWIEAGSSPPAPAAISWLVQSPDGVTRHVVRIDRFEGPTDATVGKVVMHIKKVE
ncbi:MAG: HmuY family protein [Polyangiaceae bacterium]|nr:HmuY family protein [Polyangiaceae bacterium]